LTTCEHCGQEVLICEYEDRRQPLTHDTTVHIMLDKILCKPCIISVLRKAVLDYDLMNDEECFIPVPSLSLSLDIQELASA